MRNIVLVAGIATLVGCGGVSKEQYGAKQAEAAKYQKEAQEASAKVTQLDSQTKSLQSKVQALEQQNVACQNQVSQTNQKLSETSTEKSQLEVTAAKLTEQTTQLQGRLPIRIKDQLLFTANSSKLTPESKHTLDTIGDALAPVKGKTVAVAGYTDDTEAGGKNASARRWQLSMARALEVAKYLAGRGVDSKSIGVVGFGDGRPAVPNDSLANRAANRRVEIGLTPSDYQSMGITTVRPATLSK